MKVAKGIRLMVGNDDCTRTIQNEARVLATFASYLKPHHVPSLAVGMSSDATKYELEHG
jgi:hypothetical protein